MDKFINPIPNAGKKKVNPDGKKYTYEVYRDTKVYSPFDGQITPIPVQGNTTCNNPLIIEHFVNNKKYFSYFCEVIKLQTVVDGQFVTKDQEIGMTTDKDVTYKIIDQRNQKNIINDFMSGNFGKSSDEREKKDSGDGNVTTTTTTKKNKFSVEKSDILKDDDMFLMRRLLYPLDKLQKLVLSPLKKDVSESENKKQLMEEIERIKSLLK